MSADYCRATNRFLSKRAERDLNAFSLAQCYNSWMLGNKFQTSFPSLYSWDCFILKQIKNLKVTFAVSRDIHWHHIHLHMHIQTCGSDPSDTKSWFFCLIINSMKSVRQLSRLLAHQPVKIWQSCGWFAAAAGTAMALLFPSPCGWHTV